MLRQPRQHRPIEAEQVSVGSQRLRAGRAAERLHGRVGERVDHEEHENADEDQRRRRAEQAAQQHGQVSTDLSGKPASMR